MEIILSLSIFISIMYYLKTRALLRELKLLESRLEYAELELTLLKDEVPLNLKGFLVL
jgi:hypothetical protein